jgi:hypothetical protein
LTQLSRFNWLSANAAAKLVQVLRTTILETFLDKDEQTSHTNEDANKDVNKDVNLKKKPVASEAILFEKSVSWQRGGTQILGRVDVVHSKANMAWEVKCCTGPLELEHKLQVLLYATLWQQRQKGEIMDHDHALPIHFGLLNVLTGETLLLKKVSVEKGVEIVDLLLHLKWHAAPATADATFLQEHELLCTSICP